MILKQEQFLRLQPMAPLPDRQPATRLVGQFRDWNRDTIVQNFPVISTDEVALYDDDAERPTTVRQ